MKYTVRVLKIEELYSMIVADKIDLRPSYQRNFIWGKKDQQLLIDSILKGYPLPTFFIYKMDNEQFEMVDGQQRAETICRFIKGTITNSQKKHFTEIQNQRDFLEYKLIVTEIYDLDKLAGEDIATFYALVNKQGLHLNPAEVNKAQYATHPFMQLVEELLDTPEISALDIFTTKTQSRMNDRTLIEELVAYLYGGIFDKRDLVDEIYNSQLETTKVQELRTDFMQVIQHIVNLNKIRAIKETRFKQRGDFSTLFMFIKEHSPILNNTLLSYQYKILLWIDENGLIRPSNDDCELLQRYAFACVTQSNSKESRKTRLKILETILLNKSNNDSQIYEDFIEDLRDIFNVNDIPQRDLYGYLLIDYSKI